MLASTGALGVWQTVAQEQEENSNKIKILDFVDKNQDGINDKFQDANGDGVNDVNEESYQHRFKYEDKDKDGLNDLWQDMDGDGVNDLCHQMKKDDLKDIDKAILDIDKDGTNDITGIKYKKDDVFLDQKHGFIDERTGKIQGKLLDENGNGLDDRLEAARMHHGGRHRDYFIDEDGDGIRDGRGDALRRHRRGGGKKHGGKHN